MSNKAKDVWIDFKKFINKGNILELAIGIIVGAAFSTMLNSLVYDIFTPFISRVLDFNLTSAKWILKEAILNAEGEIIEGEIAVKYGQFIQYVVNFLVVSVSIFVGMKVFKALNRRNLKRKIKYVKKLKLKRPDLFDEADEPGTRLYERLKNEHPEFFQDEIVQKIEKEDEKAKQDPMVLEIELLSEISDKLSILINEDKEKRE